MYIPEFWVGVGTTLFCEFILTVILILVSTHGKDKK